MTEHLHGVHRASSDSDQDETDKELRELACRQSDEKRGGGSGILYVFVVARFQTLHAGLLASLLMSEVLQTTCSL